MQQYSMEEDSRRVVANNMRDGIHPIQHTEILESMYNNDIYTDTSLELHHVYDTPSLRTSGHKSTGNKKLDTVLYLHTQLSTAPN